MPNVEIYVDRTIWNDHSEAIEATLLPIRELLCADLQVDVSTCQLAILPVYGLPDQPAVNLEVMILPKPERTREAVTAVGTRLKATLAEASGARVAVRASALDPQTYVALK